MALRRYLNQLQATKPVLLTGDLNVAHLDLDIYNYFAPHVKKTPGCTQEERHSMTTTLEEVQFRCAHMTVCSLLCCTIMPDVIFLTVRSAKWWTDSDHFMARPRPTTHTGQFGPRRAMTTKACGSISEYCHVKTQFLVLSLRVLA